MAVRITGALAVALLASLLAAASDAAPCASTETCLRAIEAAQRETRSLSADFVQVKHVSLLDEPLESRGRFLFARPDRIRLDIEAPQRATVIIDGANVHIPGLSEADRKALAMTPMATMFGQLGAVFAGSTSALEGNFDVTARADGAAIQMQLVPRAEQWRRMFRSLSIRFAGDELTAETITLDDALGDSLTVTLSNARRNVEVPASAFTP